MKKIHNHRFVILGLGIVLLGMFYFFSREVKRGFLKQADFDTTVRVQEHVPARFDTWWDSLVLPVTPTPSVVVVGVLTLVALVDRKKKKIRFRALAIPLLFGLLILGETYGKSVVNHPSPPFFMIKNPTTIFPQFYVNEQFSYPSGHTARAIFFGLVILSICANYWEFSTKYLKHWAIALCVVVGYAALVATGMIYLGHHWLSDVIGGGLLGGALGLFVLNAMQLRTSIDGQHKLPYNPKNNE